MLSPSLAPIDNSMLRGSAVRVLQILFLLSIAAPAYAAPFKTKAPYALLIDDSTGKTLFQKNADSGMAPASTTKILTAEIVFSRLTSGQLKLGDTFQISAHAATEGDAESGGSSMFLKAGARVSPATTPPSRSPRGYRAANKLSRG
jgi:D-alanyl-D-alanine carboxypeptidase (penicillin-binding protein 5/6)